MSNLTFNFTGRTVIVTGAARGIGLELARQFRTAGADVYRLDFEEYEVSTAAMELGADAVYCRGLCRHHHQ